MRSYIDTKKSDQKPVETKMTPSIEDDHIQILRINEIGQNEFDSFLLLLDGYECISKAATYEKHIIAVRKRFQLVKVLSIAPSAFGTVGFSPDSEIYEVSFHKAMNAVSTLEQSEAREIRNFINVYVDLLLTTGFSMTKRTEQVLFRLANFTTIRTDIGSFFKEERISRRTACDAMTWLYGAVQSNVRLYSEKDLNRALAEIESGAVPRDPDVNVFWA